MSDEPTAAGTTASEATASTETAAAVTTATAETQTQATEAKTDGQTAAADAKVTTGPPEKYEYKVPEGITLDSEGFDAFARSFNMTNEQAQAAIDGYVKMHEAQKAAEAEGWKTTQEGWITEVKNDPKLGGSNFERTQSRLALFKSKFGDVDPDGSGVGNMPSVVRVLEAVGAAMEQDSFSTSKDGSHESGSVAQRFYPGMNP